MREFMIDWTTHTPCPDCLGTGTYPERPGQPCETCGGSTVVRRLDVMEPKKYSAKRVPVWALVQVHVLVDELRFPDSAANVAKAVQKTLDRADMANVHLYDVGLPETAATLITGPTAKPEPEAKKKERASYRNPRSVDIKDYPTEAGPEQEPEKAAAVEYAAYQEGPD